MIQLITFLIAITIRQPFSVDQRTPDKNFDLIEDFHKDKAIFRADKFDLAGQSVEGGQLVAFHHKDKAYLVMDIWIFGEMGKVNATYWMDKNLNFLIVKEDRLYLRQAILRKGLQGKRDRYVFVLQLRQGEEL
jgi:hypothetical protein